MIMRYVCCYWLLVWHEALAKRISKGKSWQIHNYYIWIPFDVVLGMTETNRPVSQQLSVSARSQISYTIVSGICCTVNSRFKKEKMEFFILRFDSNSASRLEPVCCKEQKKSS